MTNLSDKIKSFFIKIAVFCTSLVYDAEYEKKSHHYVLDEKKNLIFTKKTLLEDPIIHDCVLYLAIHNDLSGKDNFSEKIFTTGTARIALRGGQSGIGGVRNPAQLYKSQLLSILISFLLI